MSQTNGATRTEVVKSPITLDKIYTGENQKPGTLTAQLRQSITTKSYYPSKKIDSDMQDNLFSGKDFGFAEQEFISTENRVAWIPVPLSATEDQVKTMLAAAMAGGACIYKVLSSEPILDNNQEYAITAGLRTMSD
jgi:hypothetical protein